MHGAISQLTVYGMLIVGSDTRTFRFNKQINSRRHDPDSIPTGSYLSHWMEHIPVVVRN